MEQAPNLTQLLSSFAKGDVRAAEQVIPLVYDELHRIAHRRRWQWGGSESPGTTSLVHEVYVNLVERSHADWRDRSHFFYFASVAMRNILIDSAKRVSRAKRGGGEPQIPPGEHTFVSEQRSDELLALDQVLDRLRSSDERLSRIVECRFFGGLSVEETADALAISPATVKRGWDTARAWLYKELKPEGF